MASPGNSMKLVLCVDEHLLYRSKQEHIIILYSLVPIQGNIKLLSPNYLQQGVVYSLFIPFLVNLRPVAPISIYMVSHLIPTL